MRISMFGYKNTKAPKGKQINVNHSNNNTQEEQEENSKKCKMNPNQFNLNENKKVYQEKGFSKWEYPVQILVDRLSILVLYSDFNWNLKMWHELRLFNISKR